MDLSWASLPSASDPALAEWLEGASCGPHVKTLTELPRTGAPDEVLSMDGLDLPAGAPAPAGQ